jgi:hypothetical protein
VCGEWIEPETAGVYRVHVWSSVGVQRLALILGKSARSPAGGRSRCRDDQPLPARRPSGWRPICGAQSVPKRRESNAHERPRRASPKGGIPLVKPLWATAVHPAPHPREPRGATGLRRLLRRRALHRARPDRPAPGAGDADGVRGRRDQPRGDRLHQRARHLDAARRCERRG